MTKKAAREHINNLIAKELEVAPKQANGYDTYICPLCENGSGDTGDGISTKDGERYKCFKCGFYGDFLDLLKQKHDCSETVVFSLYDIVLDNDEPQSLGASVSTPKQEKELVDYTDYFEVAHESLLASPSALRELERRGISKKTAVRFNIGFDEEWQSPKALREGKYAPKSPRIILPTGDYSYIARAVYTDEKVKFMWEGTPQIFNRVAMYDNEDNVYIGERFIFVTEGIFDALSVVEAGGEAIALGGTSNVNKLLSMFESAPPDATLILSLDNDDAGQKAQKQLKKGLEALEIPFIEANISGKYKDPNEHLRADKESFKTLVSTDPAELVRLEAEAKKEKYLKTSAAHQISAFKGDIDERANTREVPTGFKKLDDVLDGGLYEGLYAIGAISSLGKTSFILQCADQMARLGTDIIIFSLEMSRYELMAKSISRLTLERCEGNNDLAKSTRDILNGSRWKHYSDEEKVLLERSINEYETYAKNIYIHEGIGTIGVAQIKEEVRKHIEITGKRPVVIIDYLQIIAPINVRATEKQNTDLAVLELKRLSRDEKVPIIAISSFNRENYMSPVNMTAFKESGAIEYSSDVLLGLQFAGMDEVGAEKKVDAVAKVEKMKSDYPREVQLKVLKNRNSKTGESLFYKYYTKCNLFKEMTSPNAFSQYQNGAADFLKRQLNEDKNKGKKK
jgi:replicative DNA helicase